MNNVSVIIISTSMRCIGETYYTVEFWRCISVNTIIGIDLKIVSFWNLYFVTKNSHCAVTRKMDNYYFISFCWNCFAVGSFGEKMVMMTELDRKS